MVILHAIVQVDVLAVQIFIASILYKLSNPPKKRPDSAQAYIELRIKELRANEDFLHTQKSLVEIATAI